MIIRLEHLIERRHEASRPAIFKRPGERGGIRILAGHSPQLAIDQTLEMPGPLADLNQRLQCIVKTGGAVNQFPDILRGNVGEDAHYQVVQQAHPILLPGHIRCDLCPPAPVR